MAYIICYSKVQVVYFCFLAICIGHPDPQLVPSQVSHIVHGSQAHPKFLSLNSGESVKVGHIFRWMGEFFTSWYQYLLGNWHTSLSCRYTKNEDLCVILYKGTLTIKSIKKIIGPVFCIFSSTVSGPWSKFLKTMMQHVKDYLVGWVR